MSDNKSAIPNGHAAHPANGANGHSRAWISDDVVRRSLHIQNRTMPRSPFVAPSFPPQVERALRENNVPTIAQDQEIGSTFGWAGADPIYASYAEGVVFLGYSYLATLAQRGEYRVVSETIASEMTREWIELRIASDDKTKGDLKNRLEDKLNDLDVQHCFRQVAESDGFFGRGHLYLDTGCTDDPDELITDLGDGRSIMSQAKIGPEKNQKLIRLQPVEATWCYPTFYESIDPLKRDWYNPVTWYVMSREVHKSRLLTFVGRPVPDILKPAYAFGGLAMTQMLKPYVDNWLRTRQAVSDMVQNFSHNVLKTNLDATLGQGGDQMFARIALFNNIKNNQGTLVIDKDSEDWANVSTGVGSLDRVQAQAQEHMASISRIPIVKLLGIQPAGLNASSEGELVAFEDWIHSFQESLFRDKLQTILNLVQLSEFGYIDDDITFDFKPIRQLKPIEKQQLNSIISQTREQYFQMGAVDANEIREVLAQDEDSPFHGLDLTKPLPQQPGMPPMPQMPGMGGGGGGGGGGPGGAKPQKPPSFLPSMPKPPDSIGSKASPEDDQPHDEMPLFDWAAHNYDFALPDKK